MLRARRKVVFILKQSPTKQIANNIRIKPQKHATVQAVWRTIDSTENTSENTLNELYPQ